MNEPAKIFGLDRKLALGLIGVLALVPLWLFVVSPLLLGGDDMTDPVVDPVVGAAGQDGEVAAGADAPEAGDESTDEIDEELPPIGETFEVFTARDPFQQLVSEDTGGGDLAVVGGQPTADGGTPTDASDDTGTGPGSGDGDRTDDGTPPESTTEDGTTVAVDDVFTDDGTEYVLLTANGTAYTLTEGDTFASNWRVEAIDDPCVTLLYGDQARLVCEGESIRK